MIRARRAILLNKGSGPNKKSDYRVQAVVTLPVMH